MKFLAVAALFFAGVLATPTTPTTLQEHYANTQSSGSGAACPDGLYSNAQCCDADILGIIGVGCSVPINAVRDARSLREECARYGKQGRCCVVPILGQALLCQAPVGANFN